VWDFLRQDWTYLVERFSLNDRLFGRLLADVAESFTTPERVEELRAHFEAWPEAGAGEQYRKIALERARANVNFGRRYAGAIGQWLAQKAQ